MRRFIAAAALAAILIGHPALAAEPLPGDACGAANNLLFTGGPEVVGGGGHALLCQSGTWKSILSFNSTAGLTKLGNQTCATNEILKFNGSTWACAADGGMSGLPTLTAANIWVGNASNAATAVTMSGDATLSNAGVLTIGTGAVGSTEITDGSIANADLAGSIALSKLSITGTGSASNFLRGDGSWQTVPAGADNLGNHTATQTIVSDTTNTDDLGTTAIRWKDGWFAGTVTAGTFAGSGASLTSLNATNLASGAVPAARMPALTGDVTMTAGTTATNIAAGAIGTAEIADGSVANADLAGSIDLATKVTGNLAVARLNGGTGASATTFWRGDGTWTSTLTGSMTAQMFYHTSDARLKQDVVTLVDPIETIQKLRGVRYVWKDSGKPSLGFIAQEVELILPEAVQTDGKGIKSLEYDQLIAPLVEAVKAQQKIIDSQNQRIERLEQALGSSGRE